MKSKAPVTVPLFIRIWIWLAALFALGAFVSIGLAYFGIGSFRIGGMPLSHAEWLHIAARLVAVIGLLMACVAYGFASRKSWSRHCAMLVWIVIIAYAIAEGAMKLVPRQIMWRAIIQASLFGCVSGWYLHATRNVAEYFRSLRH